MMLTISRRSLAHVFGLIVLSQWPTLSSAQDSLGSDVQEFDNAEDATLDGSLSQAGSDASAQTPVDAAGESSSESAPNQNSSAETAEKIGDQAQPAPEVAPRYKAKGSINWNNPVVIPVGCIYFLIKSIIVFF